VSVPPTATFDAVRVYFVPTRPAKAQFWTYT
jgi:hypothetical protein